MQRVPWPKRLRRALRAHAIRVLLALVGLLPLRLALALGRWGGGLAWHFFPKDRGLALEHLAFAFPEKTQEERERIARRMFVSLGELGMELAQLRRIDRRMESYVELGPETERVLREAVRAGRGAVVVTGHIGNWELLLRRCVRGGFDAYAVGKESHDPRFTAMMERVRGKERVIWRGAPGASRQMLRVFRKNGYLAMLIDQDTDVQGVFVPFFGKLAWTPRAAADLALRTGAGLTVLFIHRKEEGGHWITARPVVVQRSGDDEADAHTLTAALTREIEEEIRRYPHEWVWMHRRWKTRPKAEGGKSP